MACRKEKTQYGRNDETGIIFPSRKLYGYFSPGFAAPIPDIRYQGELPDYRRRDKTSPEKMDKQSVRRERIASLIGCLVIFSVFSTVVSIDLGIRHYVFSLDKEKVTQMDEQFRLYQATFQHDVPLKARVQRDVYARSFIYRQDDVIPRTEPYLALCDTRDELKIILPVEKSKWTHEQKEAYEWLNYSIRQYEKNTMIFCNSFLDNIKKEILSAKFLSQSITHQVSIPFPKARQQRIYA